MGLFTNLQRSFANALFPSQFVGWIDAVSTALDNFIFVLSGSTADRPTSPVVGQAYFDTTLMEEIFWNGSAWVTADGLPPFDPTTFGACEWYVEADRGITIGATLLAAGTTPPPITVSNMPVPPLVGLYVECTLGGARGVAKVKISLDNGAHFVDGNGVPLTNITTAATIAVTIPGGTIITLAIATGTFTIGDTWNGVVSNWADITTHARDISNQVTATQPKYLINNGGGLPAVDFTAAAGQYLNRINETANITTQYTAAFVVEVDIAATSVVLGLSDFGATSGFYQWIIGTDWAVRHTTASVTDDGTDGPVQTTHYEIYLIKWTSPNAPVIRRNGTTTAIVSPPTTMTPPAGDSSLTLGSRNLGVDLFFDGRIHAAILYSEDLSIDNCLRLEAGWRTKYATPSV